MTAKPDIVRNGFKELRLSSWLIDQCTDNGVLHPTRVQYHCIPKILEGNDCIVVSQTGSGKTIAFALPILQKLSEDPRGNFALILSPTRELAMQIAEQFEVVGRPLNVQVLFLTGGVDMMYQGLRLTSQPHIIVATPGRLADHLTSCEDFSLRAIQFLVLDEADRLLGGRFDQQLKVIFDGLPKKRQTLLFSATPVEDVQDHSVESICSPAPFVWSSEKSAGPVKELEHGFVLSLPHMKEAYLAHIIQEFQEKNTSSSVIVFTKTCRFCQILSSAFNELGLQNVALHSVLSQKQRKSALSKFKSKMVKLLIATDLVGRGLDIPAVDLVINHTVPMTSTDYIHRVGRTARTGRKGMAITLVTRKSIKHLQDIEKQIGKKLSRYHQISEKRVSSILLQVNVTVKEATVNFDFESKEDKNTKEEKL